MAMEGKMRTQTEQVGTYDGMQRIAQMEANGWQVRQLVPIMEGDQARSPDGDGFVGTFTTKVWVVFEREDEEGSGWRS